MLLQYTNRCRTLRGMSAILTSALDVSLADAVQARGQSSLLLLLAGWQVLRLGVSRTVGTDPPGGTRVATNTPCRVSVIDASVGHVVTTLPAQNVYELGFSPLGTYIITWQRPTKDEEGNATKNLKVWRTLDHDADTEGERNVVGQFVQRNQTGWNLQYTFDERYCARVVTNEVQFYESGDLKTVWNKLRVEGVADFAVSPGKNHSIAVFVPERKVRRSSHQIHALGF